LSCTKVSTHRGKSVQASSYLKVVSGNTHAKGEGKVGARGRN
jgi:hypothetical protein